MARLIDTPLTRELTRQGRRREWMAKELGVKAWTFSRIESGVQPAPSDWYERAAKALGVPVFVVAAREEVAA